MTNRLDELVEKYNGYKRIDGSYTIPFTKDLEMEISLNDTEDINKGGTINFFSFKRDNLQTSYRTGQKIGIPTEYWNHRWHYSQYQENFNTEEQLLSSVNEKMEKIEKFKSFDVEKYDELKKISSIMNFSKTKRRESFRGTKWKFCC